MFLIKYIYRINYSLCLHSKKINNCGNFYTAATVSFKNLNKNENNADNDVNTVTTDNDYFYDHEDFENIYCKDHSNEISQSISLTIPSLKRYCIRNHMCISDKKFDKLIDSLTDRITNASDHELKTIFSSLSLFKTYERKCARLRNYIEVWAALDDECLKRRSTMTISDKLCYIHLFYNLGAVKYSDFCYKYLSNLLRDAKYLEKDQLLQLTFFIRLLKKFRNEKNIHNIEAYLVDHFTEFQVDELAVIANALYAINVPVRCPNLINSIIEKMIESSNEIQESSLLNLLKLMNISLKVTNYDKIYQLSDCLEHQLSRLSFKSHLYLGLLLAAANRIHEQCLSNIAESAVTCISSISLKNLERLINIYGILNFVPSTKQCFFSTIVQELRKDSREEEICKNGRIFARCVSHLRLLNIYPQDLMKKVLNKNFLELFYGKRCFSYTKDILVIHNSAQIFYKESDISNLLDSEVKILSQLYTQCLPDENKLLLDIKKTLQEYRGGDKYVISDYILTHYGYGDIIICNSHEGIPQRVDKAFVEQPFGKIRYPPDDNIWIILILGQNKIRKQTSEIDKFGRASGINITKKRELNKIGYHPAIVCTYMYNKCQNHAEKIKYLNYIISDAINYKNK